MLFTAHLYGSHHFTRTPRIASISESPVGGQALSRHIVMMWYTFFMDKETEKLIDTIAERAASNAIAKVREFHEDDLKVLGERMDIGFEKVGRDIQEVNTRLDRVENALATLLHEFKLDQEKQKQLEAKVAELTERVKVLEMQLAHQ